MSRHAATQSRREPSLAEAMLACGLRAEEAPQLFERVLSGAARDLVVSSINRQGLPELLWDPIAG